MNSYIYTTILNSRIYIKAIDPIDFFVPAKSINLGFDDISSYELLFFSFGTYYNA